MIKTTKKQWESIMNEEGRIDFTKISDLMYGVKNNSAITECMNSIISADNRKEILNILLINDFIGYKLDVPLALSVLVKLKDTYFELEFSDYRDNVNTIIEDTKSRIKDKKTIENCKFDIALIADFIKCICDEDITDEAVEEILSSWQEDFVNVVGRKTMRYFDTFEEDNDNKEIYNKMGALIYLESYCLLDFLFTIAKFDKKNMILKLPEFINEEDVTKFKIMEYSWLAMIFGSACTNSKIFIKNDITEAAEGTFKAHGKKLELEEDEELNDMLEYGCKLFKNSMSEFDAENSISTAYIFYQFTMLYSKSILYGLFEGVANDEIDDVEELANKVIINHNENSSFFGDYFKSLSLKGDKNESSL